MSHVAEEPGHVRGGRMQIPRSRGAASGILLSLLGAWGTVIGFIGPYFNFGLPGEAAWTWTEQRGLLQVLPGVIAVFGGVLLVRTGNRAAAVLGGWTAIAAGAWFVVGPVCAPLIGLGDVATTGSAEARTVAVELASFGGLGALIVLIGGLAVGRLSVRSQRDVDYVRHHARHPADDSPRTGVDMTPVPVTATDGEPGRDAVETGAGRADATPAETPTETPTEEHAGPDKDHDKDDERADGTDSRRHGWQRLFGRRHREPVAH